MKSSYYRRLIAGLLVTATTTVYAQVNPKNKVVITGVRFSYPVVQKWIDAYTAENPGAQLSIESRNTTDPEQYDVLIEAYEHDKEFKKGREYLTIGRYALLPFANAQSAFAKEYGEKGLTEKQIKQLFFHDIFAEKEKETKETYTVYTRLQKAGAPLTFARYFGYEQQNIKGKAIAGADEHLIKAVLKDNTAVSYSIPGLIYDLKNRKPVEGLTIVPVDLDGNDRVSKEEKNYGNLDAFLELTESKPVKNIPIETLHLSISKTSSNSEAKAFLLWIATHGQESLHQFGYLKADPKQLQEEKQKIENLAVKQ